MASSPFTLGPDPSRRRQTAKEFVDGFNLWNVEGIMSFRAPNCSHEILPRSLGREPRSNAEFQAYFTPFLSLIQNFKLTIHDLLEDKQANKISMWASSKGDSVIGPYANEYMLVLYFDETGEKVTRILEFVDSKASVEYFGRLSQAMKEQKPGV